MRTGAVRFLVLVVGAGCFEIGVLVERRRWQDLLDGTSAWYPRKGGKPKGEDKAK